MTALFTEQYFACVTQWARVPWLTARMTTDDSVEPLVDCLAAHNGFPCLGSRLEETQASSSALDDIRVYTPCCNSLVAWKASWLGAAADELIEIEDHDLVSGLHPDHCCPWRAQSARLLLRSSLLFEARCGMTRDPLDAPQLPAAMTPEEVLAQAKTMLAYMNHFCERCDATVQPSNELAALNSTTLGGCDVGALVLALYGLRPIDANRAAPWHSCDAHGLVTSHLTLAAAPQWLRELVCAAEDDEIAMLWECRFCGKSTALRRCNDVAQPIDVSCTASHAAHCRWRSMMLSRIGLCDGSISSSATLTISYPLQQPCDSPCCEGAVDSDVPSPSPQKHIIRFTDGIDRVKSLLCALNCTASDATRTRRLVLQHPAYTFDAMRAGASIIDPPDVPQGVTAAFAVTVPSVTQHHVTRCLLDPLRTSSNRVSGGRGPWTEHYLTLRQLLVSKKRQRDELTSEPEDAGSSSVDTETFSAAAWESAKDAFLAARRAAAAKASDAKTSSSRLSHEMACAAMRWRVEGAVGALVSTEQRQKLDRFLADVARVVAESQVVRQPAPPVVRPVNPQPQQQATSRGGILPQPSMLPLQMHHPSPHNPIQSPFGPPHPRHHQHHVRPPVLASTPPPALFSAPPLPVGITAPALFATPSSDSILGTPSLYRAPSAGVAAPGGPAQRLGPQAPVGPAAQQPLASPQPKAPVAVGPKQTKTNPPAGPSKQPLPPPSKVQKTQQQQSGNRQPPPPAPRGGKGGRGGRVK